MLQADFACGGEGVKQMATPSSSYDVVILGSGIAGLAGALAAHELGLKPVVLEKAGARRWYRPFLRRKESLNKE